MLRPRTVSRRWTVGLIARVLSGIIAGVVIWAGLEPWLPLAARLMAASAGAVLAGGADRVLADYLGFFRGVFPAFSRRMLMPRLLSFPTLLFCAVILFLLVGATANPIKILVPYDTALALLLAGLILALLPLLYRGSAWLADFFGRAPRSAWYGFLLLVGAVTCAIQIRIGYSVMVEPGWDASTVLDTARGLLTGNRLEFAETYFGWFPNNLMITWVLWQYFAVLLSFGIAPTLLPAVVFHSVLMSASVILVCSVARRVAGRTTAIFFLIPCAVFISGGGWNGVPYSDTIGMIFPALILWLIVAAERAGIGKRLGLWGLAGLVTAVGMQIKPTVVFSLVAASAVALLIHWRPETIARRKGRRDWKPVGAALASVGVAGLVSLGGISVTQNALLDAGIVAADLRADTHQVPVTHFLKMGATGIGAYQQGDLDETNSITDPRERFDNGIKVYLERIGEMGPVGYAQQIVTKMTWSVGDGSFFAWAEGLTHLKSDYPATDPTSRGIREYYTALGSHSVVVRTIWQATWYVVLLLLAMPLMMRRGILFTRSATMMRLSLLALIVFLAVFENRGRYLYLYLPYFLLLASITVTAAASLASRKRRSRLTPFLSQKPSVTLLDHMPSVGSK